jgi:hypothetical protein
MGNKEIGKKTSSPRRLGGTLAPALMSIVTAAEAAGWLVRREDYFVELRRPASAAGAYTSYQINSRWWCLDLTPQAAGHQGQSFRVTAPSLRALLGKC